MKKKKGGGGSRPEAMKKKKKISWNTENQVLIKPYILFPLFSKM